jgi:hypothetical protein
VQGKLRNQYLKIKIDSECAHCGHPMEIEINSELEYKSREKDCQPVIFVPDVNLFKVEDDSIIDSF